MKRLAFVFSLLLVSLSVHADGTTNLASSGTAEATSIYDKRYAPARAIDGKVSDRHRWVSKDSNEGHVLTITLSASFTLGGAHLYSGFQTDSQIVDFDLEYWDGDKWLPIPGARIRGNKRTKLRIEFKRPIETTRVRLVGYDERVRVKELLLWMYDKKEGVPPLGAGIKDGPPPSADLSKHHVFVNQSGYDTEGPKRFTAVNSPDGSKFVLTQKQSDEVLFEGVIHNGIGDFTDFEPGVDDVEYVVKVSGKDKRDGKSFPFAIRPLHNLRQSLSPALQFMIDSRSMVGTHPSGYGGTAWRDGTYYTHELPSIVMMYLSNPAYFEQLPAEIDYESEKKRLLNNTFRWVRASKDADLLDAVRRYYTQLDPPVAPEGKKVPDAVQLIHWGIGMMLMDPESEDPSGGQAGNKLHDQTLEQFAYFLYAYPSISCYFTDAFYRQAEAFARENWEAVGLFEVIKQYENAKGRKAPGHSVMPNLLMYEAAKRNDWPEADRYLEAAVAQASWIVQALSPSEPSVGKGQRMSEHKTITGLALLATEYTEQAPDGLARWLSDWVNHAVAQSDNAYDFRKYDDKHWTLPKPWNEPGNIAGFPGILSAVSPLTQDPAVKDRLVELQASHIDNLFGRNPLNAASSAQDNSGYFGIDAYFPKRYHRDWCARLELCRGALNSNAASEHYPLNPNAGFRHCEGWTAFNAAWNVSLAYLSSQQTGFDLIESNDAGVVKIRMRLPLDLDPQREEEVQIEAVLPNGNTSSVPLKEVSASDVWYEGEFKLGIPSEKGALVVLQYGHGFLKSRLNLVFNPKTTKWEEQK